MLGLRGGRLEGPKPSCGGTNGRASAYSLTASPPKCNTSGFWRLSGALDCWVELGDMPFLGDKLVGCLAGSVLLPCSSVMLCRPNL